jgi:prevent-host-death family protein
MADIDPKIATTLNVHEAKTHFSKLLDRAHAGEEIVVAKAGKPYAKLVAIDAKAGKPKRRPGRLKGIVPELPDSFFFDPLPEEELRLWEGR